MVYRILVVTIFSFLFLGAVNAQSKKEHIIILSNKIDSLTAVIENERLVSQSKESTLNLTIDSITKRLSATKIELTRISKDFDKKNEESRLLNANNQSLQAQLFSLKAESLKLRLKLDSVLKLNANCNDIIQALSEANVPTEVPMDQGCTDCNWYAFDKDNYEEGDLLFIQRINLDQLFFILCNKVYSIPMTYRKFNESYTETGKADGNGTLIFQGEGIKVIYSFYQDGYAYGSEGYVEIYRSDKLIKKVLVRSTL
jgi:hypothetical protein